MQPPSHEACLRQQSATDTRNRLYLKLIFDHSSTLCNTVYDNCGANYVCAYDELVKNEGHGTPGSTLLKSRVTVPALLLTDTGGSRRDLEQSSRRRLQRADELVNAWKQLQGPARAFWEAYWQDSYRGFLDAQKELGKLRDDIGRGELEGESRHSLEYLKKKLNEMLLASVREWYLKWGEVDLHRLSFRDAAELLWGILRQPAWREMRIVGGQRQHGGAHSSEGVLFGLLQMIFGDDLNAVSGIVGECRRFVLENGIEVKFYSNGAAVWLKKKRRPVRSSSAKL